MKASYFHFGLLALISAPAAALSTQDADESALDALDAAAPKPPPPRQEPAGAPELRDAVRRIAQRPTDSYALSDAGYAAVKLGDYDAAFNFFTKANALQPADARIKAGLAIAQVRRENPFEALSLFDEAIRLGTNERAIALDRALAFDLLGNFERAQRDYTLAASYAVGDELTLRRAISLSLAGRRDEADAALIPMLQKENPEAWRARALMLAARGDHKEAGKIALGFLPEAEARRMDGFFRNMPRLTPAQQAAAMHFGHFPLGSDIGEDSNAVRSMAAATGAKPEPAKGDARLIPSGEPLGGKGTKPAKTARKDKDDPKPVTGIKTASAQQAVDAASRARVTTVAATQLPPPEAARPPVRIALPAFSRPATVVASAPETKPVTTELPAVGPPVGAVPVTPKPVVVVAQAEPQPQIQPPPQAQTPPQVQTTPPAQTTPQPLSVPQQPVPKPVQPEVRIAQIDPATVINDPPAPAVPAPNIAPAEPQKPVQGPDIGPGFESVPAMQVATATPSPPETVASSAPATTEIMPAAATPTPAPVEVASAPFPAPVVEKPFDLGALVASIDVPDAEKKPSVAPVDLKKIKAAAPKPDAAATAKADAAKSAKAPVAGPRIWVQIATGGDAAGLGSDFRRMAKKNGALFANREGWTAVWGKTKRLLVGPFADMKAAKKWEADFRKSGGDGFVWQSDKSAEIEKLKSK
jgi:Flp pilus assembly protein TadD